MSAYLKTSPSQKTTFDLCPRRWAFGSIKRLPQPQNPDAAKGEELHKQMEAWSLHAIPPTHPSCVEMTKYIAPPKSENVDIEAKTTNPPLYVAGLLVNGRVDYLDYRNREMPTVLDFKSKGKSLKGLSRDQLAVDPQLNLYGAWVIQRFPEAQSVIFAHGYISRDEANPGAKLVTPKAAVPRAQIEATVESYVPGFEAMKTAAAKEPLDLPPNYDACYAFGAQCPFYTHCFPSVSERFKTMFHSSEDDVGIVDKLRANAGAATLPPLPGTTTATPVPVAAETTPAPKPGRLLARLTSTSTGESK